MLTCVHTHVHTSTHTSKTSTVIFYAAQLQRRSPFKHNQVQENTAVKGKTQEGTASPEPHEKWKVWLSETTAASRAPALMPDACRVHTGAAG